jgi:predicted permease
MLGGEARHGRRVLVIAQVALAMVVIAVAGLLTRSLVRLETMDVGLAKDQLVFAELSLPFAMYSDRPRHFRFMADLKEQLEGTAEISVATPVNVMPFSGTGGWDMPQFTAEGQSAERALLNPALNMEVVHPDHFATLGIPLVRGRAFTEADGPGAPPVTIVSEDVAGRTWPGADPIGKRLKGGGMDSQDPWRTVVGVAAKVRYRELTDARATIFFPARQFNFPGGLMVLRTTADPARVATITQERVRSIDSNVQVLDVTPFAALLAQPLARPRFSALLIGAFGITALLLAAVGLFGVMSAYVRQRNAEIGIRVALGASTADVRWLVLGEGMKLAVIGALIGLSMALASARLVRGLLYEVDPLDPANMLGAGSLLLIVAALACYLPAWRATRVDPMTVLRAE